MVVLRDSVEEKLDRERHEAPSAVSVGLAEGKPEESPVEEGFEVTVPRIWLEEELVEEMDVDVLEDIRKPFVEEELYEEEMDVDLSGALSGESR